MTVSGKLQTWPVSYNAAMRYRLRTLLILLAIGPPLLALVGMARCQSAVLATRAN